MIPQKLITAYAEAKGWNSENELSAEEFVMLRMSEVAMNHIGDCAAKASRQAALADVDALKEQLGLKTAEAVAST